MKIRTNVLLEEGHKSILKKYEINLSKVNRDFCESLLKDDKKFEQLLKKKIDAIKKYTCQSCNKQLNLDEDFLYFPTDKLLSWFSKDGMDSNKIKNNIILICKDCYYYKKNGSLNLSRHEMYVSIEESEGFIPINIAPIKKALEIFTIDEIKAETIDNFLRKSQDTHPTL